MSNRTRGEIEARYEILNGRIVSPGKFEGEPIWLPYFWNLALDGAGIVSEFEEGTPVNTFTVQSEDFDIFPELTDIRANGQQVAISVWQNDLGFICYQVTVGNASCTQCGKCMTSQYKCPVCKECK